MIREAILWTSETLFYLMNGTALITTPWIFVWVLFWVLVISTPVIYFANRLNSAWAGLLILVVFFTGLFMAIGPGVTQAEMLHECETVKLETVDTSIDGETVNLGPVTMNRCRHKDNYYGEFGDWKLVGEIK